MSLSHKLKGCNNNYYNLRAQRNIFIDSYFRKTFMTRGFFDLFVVNMQIINRQKPYIMCFVYHMKATERTLRETLQKWDFLICVDELF